MVVVVEVIVMIYDNLNPLNLQKVLCNFVQIDENCKPLFVRKNISINEKQDY